jgi:hypothetical protein
MCYVPRAMCHVPCAVATIQRVAGWILHAVDVCNERIGEPYRKCTEAFDYAVNDCRLVTLVTLLIVTSYSIVT